VPVDELDASGLAWAQRLAQRPLNALRTTKQRFAAAAETLCPAAGSQADADALLAAYRDGETQQMQQRYIGARQR
jgi:1,4-dihydroxy-2-naphthoyl-CoA synthase